MRPCWQTQAQTRPPTLEERLELGVPVQELIDFMTKEIREEAGCMQLPWVLLLFLSFVFVIRTHFQPLVQHGVHQSIERELEDNINFAFTTAIPNDAPRFGQKGLADIAAVEDIVSFLQVGIIPRPVTARLPKGIF